MTTMTTERPDPNSRSTPTTTTTTQRVQDEHQTLEFTGTRVGFATTETPDSPRWTEIEIFRTEAGNYVVHRVGVSLVYHDPRAACASGTSMIAADMIHSNDDHEPCPRCAPPGLDSIAESKRVKREMDRHSAEAVKKAQDLVAALSLSRPNGTKFLSAVARDALESATEHDESIRRLMDTTVHVP